MLSVFQPSHSLHEVHEKCLDGVLKKGSVKFHIVLILSVCHLHSVVEREGLTNNFQPQVGEYNITVDGNASDN